MKQVTLITGGAKSGKSNQALNMVQDYDRKAFIATAEPVDDEMKERIRKHQEKRDQDIHTIEEPISPVSALEEIPNDTEVTIIDCITVWLGNLSYEYETYPSSGVYDEVDDFLDVLSNPPCNLIMITNEVGMGLVPDYPEGRKYRDLAGIVNQKLADRSDEVLLMISGIPVPLSSL